MHPFARRDAMQTIAAKLYEGVLDADEWYAGLDAIRCATGGALFYQFAVDMRSLGVVASLQNTDIPADMVREYEIHHAPHDERMPLVMGLPVGHVMFDHEHFTPRQLSRSFIYSDWLPSLGYRHTFSATLHDDGQIREFLSIIRPVDRGPFSAEDRAFIMHLMPDLQRATRLRSRMVTMATQAVWGHAALDTLPQAVVLVDAGCRVLHLNRAARHALEHGSCLTVHHGLLCTKDPGLQVRLVQAVATACRREGQSQASVVSAGPASNGACGSIWNVLPLLPWHPLAAAHHERPHALIAWANPHGALEVAQLSALLGLTDAEASLALQLAHGKSLKHFAMAHGCSWHTARTHAKNLLRKTGLHRQAEVALLVRSLMHVG